MYSSLVYNHVHFELQDSPVADRVLRNTLDTYVILATAESQARVEVLHALDFRDKLCNGSLLGSSLAAAPAPCEDTESLGTTLVLGEESSQDRALISPHPHQKHDFIQCQFHLIQKNQDISRYLATPIPQDLHDESVEAVAGTMQEKVANSAEESGEAFAGTMQEKVANSAEESGEAFAGTMQEKVANSAEESGEAFAGAMKGKPGISAEGSDAMKEKVANSAEGSGEAFAGAGKEKPGISAEESETMKKKPATSDAETVVPEEMTHLVAISDDESAENPKARSQSNFQF